VAELKTAKNVLFLFVAAILFVLPVNADEAEDKEKEELARQETFREGMRAIVDDLNHGSFDSFIKAINQSDMVERIFGLRLIDQKIKRQFNEQLEYSYEGMITSAFVIPEDGLKATLLGVESRGDLGRAVVRFDLPKLQFNYHEYELRLDKRGRVAIVDWTDYLKGMKFSEGIGRSMVMVAPSKSAMRKLLDFQNVNEQQLFQFGELLKSVRDRRPDRYREIRDGMEPRFQRQRIVIESSVQIARQTRKRRQMVAALQIMAEQFPEEPLYSLMLLDYYFPSKKYTEAVEALQRLSNRLDFEDAAMEARLSATALVMGNPQDAAAYADMALGREPGLELAWWSALNARAALSDFTASVEALQVLESEFGYELDADALQRDPGYAELLASDEFNHWLETRE
jgi:tetratricopeptide (TPR) repeat protein